MFIVCSDLEGVFVPEIWINVALKTGIEELKLTTRDVSDYDVLMKGRLEILKRHGITLADIQQVISTLKPLTGAKEFLDWLREQMQVIIVSDTFTEFASPLIRQLGSPTIFCNSLVTDKRGMITDYRLRQNNGKKRVAEALQCLNYNVIGIGDSYNDIAMIRQSDHGVFFNPPENVSRENSDIRSVRTYEELKSYIAAIL